MATIPETQQTPLSPKVQASYDRLMAQLDNIEEITRESVISSQQTIARFERQYHMTSADMREKLMAGEIEETYDICCWVQEIDILKLVLADLK